MIERARIEYLGRASRVSNLNTHISTRTVAIQCVPCRVQKAGVEGPVLSRNSDRAPEPYMFVYNRVVPVPKRWYVFGRRKRAPRKLTPRIDHAALLLLVIIHSHPRV